MAARLPGSSRAVTTVDVAQYYDQNTRRFLFMGKGRPSVHRELWAPGVDSVERAMAHVDHLVVDEPMLVRPRDVGDRSVELADFIEE